MALTTQLGFRQQHFAFTAYDVNQVGYGIYADYTGTVSGKVIDYSATYNLPYVGFTATLPSSAVRVAIDLSYTPWVSASDVDDHVLRYKRSTGNSTGSAWSIGAHAAYKLRDNLDLTGYATYSSIHTKGTQTQYYYADSDEPAGTTYTIAQELTSQQSVVGLKLTTTF